VPCPAPRGGGIRGIGLLDEEDEDEEDEEEGGLRLVDDDEEGLRLVSSAGVDADDTMDGVSLSDPRGGGTIDVSPDDVDGRELTPPSSEIRKNPGG
jgi:hypothetical protein